MEIIVLNGSPRGEQSNTLKLTKAFLRGMQKEEKHSIQIIDLNDLNIEFCRGCRHCLYDGNCVLHDDMDYLLPLVLSADCVIFSFPLFSYAINAITKKVIERMLPIYTNEIKKVDNHYEHILQMDITNIKFVMISTCGFPQVEENFDSAVIHFKTCFRNNSTVFTVPEGPILEASQFDQFTKPLIKQFEEAGFIFAESGYVSDELCRKLSMPVVPEKLFEKWVNYEMYIYRERNSRND